jgi:predicted transposase YdaD
MLKIHDIRESRVYQEAKAEGFEEGVEIGVEKERARRIQSVAKLGALQMPPHQIAEVLDLDIEVVRRELAKIP